MNIEISDVDKEKLNAIHTRIVLNSSKNDLDKLKERGLIVLNDDNVWWLTKLGLRAIGEI